MSATNRSVTDVADPRVTIVVTAYNQAAFLPAAISSALGQTVGCDVVVVDDGSTDGSVDVATAHGVRVERRQHAGALATFRHAVSLVRTEFYVLLNGDDELEPDYVERTLPHADDPRVGFVYTGYRLIGADDRIVGALPFDIRSLRWGNYVHAASLTRTAAYHAAGGFDPRFADHHEDWALWVAIARNGWIGVPVDLPLLRYRRHGRPGRNPDTQHAAERARWRLFRRDPGLYGPLGLGRLVLSSAKLALSGR